MVSLTLLSSSPKLDGKGGPWLLVIQGNRSCVVKPCNEKSREIFRVAMMPCHLGQAFDRAGGLV